MVQKEALIRELQDLARIFVKNERFQYEKKHQIFHQYSAMQ